MERQLIFVSSSQAAAHRPIAEKVASLINAEPGFRAFFAGTVGTPEAATVEIFHALEECVGFVGFFHARGEVCEADGTFRRSSVWVNQELAIILFRRLHDHEPIPVLAFQESHVRWEGFLAHTMVNPRPMGSETAIVTQVRQWLTSEEFSASITQGVFASAWGKLTPKDKTVLRALQDLQGKSIHDLTLRDRLREAYALSLSHIALLSILERIRHAGFIDLQPADPGYKQSSIQDGWRLMIRRRLAAEASESGRE